MWLQLADVALVAWQALLRSHRHLVDTLDRDLRERADLPLEQYDVLYQLRTVADGWLRMSDLAERLLVSRSSCTRIVDALVRQELVQRRDDPEDRRAVRVELTTEGRRVQRRAGRIHVAGIEANLTSRLSSAELEALATALSRLLDD